jgi:hypothetical protein
MQRKKYTEEQIILKIGFTGVRDSRDTEERRLDFRG